MGQEGVIKLEPVRTYCAVTFGAALLLTLLLRWTFSLDLVLSWLTAITLVAFLAYGYDLNNFWSNKV